ncbi:ATP-binding protein, partial [Schumannella luteola]
PEGHPRAGVPQSSPLSLGEVRTCAERPRGGAMVRPVIRPGPRPLHTTTVPDRPLLERAAELAAIDGALAGAESGSTRTVVVVGEPGIGKSSLLTEGAALAVARGFDVRRAVFTVLSAQTPHGLLWEWFGADAHDEEPGPAFDGPAEMLRDVLRGERTAEPVALAYAAQWALSALDEERPLLLLVDDLQWADEASRRLLTTLVARLSTERIAILIATRPDPALD